MRSFILSLVSLLIGSVAVAATKYDVDYTINCVPGCVTDVTVTGFIEMDSLGSGLSSANISDWELTLSSLNHPSTLLNPSNGKILSEGTYSLTATATELLLIMPEMTSADYGIFSFTTTQAWPYTVDWHFQGGGGSITLQVILSNAPVSVYGQPFDQATKGIGTSTVIATALSNTSPVPLPASLPLLAGGLVAGAFLASRRRKAA